MQWPGGVVQAEVHAWREALAMWAAMADKLHKQDPTMGPLPSASLWQTGGVVYHRCQFLLRPYQGSSPAAWLQQHPAGVVACSAVQVVASQKRACTAAAP